VAAPARSVKKPSIKTKTATDSEALFPMWKKATDYNQVFGLSEEDDPKKFGQKITNKSNDPQMKKQNLKDNFMFTADELLSLKKPEPNYFQAFGMDEEDEKAAANYTPKKATNVKLPNFTEIAPYHSRNSSENELNPNENAVNQTVSSMFLKSKNNVANINIPKELTPTPLVYYPDMGYNGNGILDVHGNLTSNNTNTEKETFLRAPTAKEKEQLQNQDEQWTAFQAHFANGNEMRSYLMSLSEKQLKKLPKPIQYQAQIIIDSEHQNNKDYLSDYGNIPWLAALNKGFLNGLSMGISNEVLKKSDSDRAQQYASTSKDHPLAAGTGEVLGWLTPGSLGNSVVAGTNKLIEPAMKPIEGIIKNAAQRLPGKIAPKVVQSATTNAIKSGASGYGIGFASEGLRSAAEGNHPIDVLKNANSAGLHSARVTMIAGEISGGVRNIEGRNRKKV